MTKQSSETYQYDKIFEQTMHRLNNATDVSAEDKTSITQLVEHLARAGKCYQ